MLASKGCSSFLQTFPFQAFLNDGLLKMLSRKLSIRKEKGKKNKKQKKRKEGKKKETTNHHLQGARPILFSFPEDKLSLQVPDSQGLSTAGCLL